MPFSNPQNLISELGFKQCLLRLIAAKNSQSKESYYSSAIDASVDLLPVDTAVKLFSLLNYCLSKIDEHFHASLTNLVIKQAVNEQIAITISNNSSHTCCAKAFLESCMNHIQQSVDNLDAAIAYSSHDGKGFNLHLLLTISR